MSVAAELRTSTVMSMIEAVRRDWSLCPLLADALDDAGCEDVAELAELRSARPSREAVGAYLLSLLGWRIVVTPRDDRSGRLRRRTVDAESEAESVAFTAVASPNGRAWSCRHGGDVPNNYGYPAATEGVLAAAVVDAEAGIVRVVWWGVELPANKVTAAGVAAMAGYRDLCDGRVSAERRAAAEAELFAAVTAQ